MKVTFHVTVSFSLANPGEIEALTIHICEDISGKKPQDIAPVTKLIGWCTNLTFLHLSLRPGMVYGSSLFSSTLRGLSCLRQLELKGCVLDDHSISSVVLLQNTNSLEVLSLIPLLPDPPKKDYFYDPDLDRPNVDDAKDGYCSSGNVFVPKRLWKTDIRCFKRRLRRIKLVGYGGQPFEKMLAKFLLSKAAALEELSVSMAPGRSEQRDEMVRQLMSWRIRRQTVVTCA